MDLITTKNMVGFNNTVMGAVGESNINVIPNKDNKFYLLRERLNEIMIILMAFSR